MVQNKLQVKIGLIATVCEAQTKSRVISNLLHVLELYHLMVYLLWKVMKMMKLRCFIDFWPDFSWDHGMNGKSHWDDPLHDDKFQCFLFLPCDEKKLVIHLQKLVIHGFSWGGAKRTNRHNRVSPILRTNVAVRATGASTVSLIGERWHFPAQVRGSSGEIPSTAMIHPRINVGFQSSNIYIYMCVCVSYVYGLYIYI